MQRAVPAMLDLFRRCDVRCTWATFGFLFARDKTQRMDRMTAVGPGYDDANLSPHPHHDAIGDGE